MASPKQPPTNRVSDPPRSIQNLNADLYRYLNDLVREIEINFKDTIEFSPLTSQLPVFTVAGLSVVPPSIFPNSLVYVTSVGPAYSNGANWLRMSNETTVA